MDLAEETDSGVTGPIDESPLRSAQVGQPGEFEHHSGCQADSGRHAETEEEIQKIDGARKPRGGEPQEADGAERGTGGVRRGEAGDIADGDVSPPAAIQFEEREDEDLGRNKDAKRRQQVGPVLRGHGEVKPQDEREDAGDGEDGELNGSHHPARVLGKVAGDPMDVKSWHGDGIPQMIATGSSWSSGSDGCTVQCGCDLLLDPGAGFGGLLVL